MQGEECSVHNEDGVTCNKGTGIIFLALPVVTPVFMKFAFSFVNQLGRVLDGEDKAGCFGGEVVKLSLHYINPHILCARTLC